MTNKNHFCGILFRMSILLLVALLGTPASQAKPIDLTKATSIAEDFFSSKTNGKTRKAIKAKSGITNGALDNRAIEPAYYVFTPEKTAGFVIVSADDELQPIVGYSLNTNYDSENLPDALVAYLSDYSKVVKAISDGQIEYKASTRGGVAVAPLLKVEWDQDEPYNRYTPELYDGNAPTGCVATAIAQIMKYYEFPQKGNGTVQCSYGTQDLGHEYDWANMLDVYAPGSYSDEQANAVSVLMRDIGYSVEMSYGSNVSSASSAAIAGAMCRNFNYSPDIRYFLRSCFSSQAWIDEIRENLLRSEPVLYSGISVNGKVGHQFVCDGIDADDMLHINWGWGGSSDGYFDMNILSPSNLGIGAGDGAYYAEQDIVSNIRPGDPDADYLPTRLPITVSKIRVSGYTDENGKLNDTYSMCVNIEHYNATGSVFESDVYKFGFALKNSADEFVGIYGINNVWSLYNGYYRNSAYYIPIKNLIDNGVLPDGKYSISIVCLPNSVENDSQPTMDEVLPLASGDLNNIVFTVKEGEIYLDNPELATNTPLCNVKIISGGTLGEQFVGMNTLNLSLTMQNTGQVLVDKESYYLYMVPESEDNDGITGDFLNDNYSLYSIGMLSNVYLYPGVTQELREEIYTTNLKAGKYRLYATYYNSSEGGYKIMDMENPVYIEILDLPENSIFITKPITNYWPETSRSFSPWINIVFTYFSSMDPFESEFQVWCRKKGADESEEFLFYKDENIRTIYPGQQEIEIWGWGEAGCLWFEELGTEYEAIIKYVDKDGNTVPVTGSGNSYQFTLVEDDSDQAFNCISPMVINGGKPVDADYGYTFDVEFEFSVKSDVTLYPDFSRISVSKNPKDLTNPLKDFFYVSSLKYDKTQLTAGETTKATATISYLGYNNDDDIIGNTLYLLPMYLYGYIGESLYSFPVQVMPYLESTGFLLKKTNKTASEIVLSTTSLALKVGETKKIDATVLPDNTTDKTVVWTSSNEAVATVDAKGNVTALHIGESTLTASCGSVSATCNIFVNPTLVESLSVSPDNWNGTEGESFRINVTVTPENATDKTVLFTSSDESVAQVNSEGLVTTLSSGTCKIVVATVDGSNLTAECLVTSVSGIEEIISEGDTSWDVYGTNGILLKKNCDKDDLKLLNPGVYILQSGQKTVKIILR